MPVGASILAGLIAYVIVNWYKDRNQAVIAFDMKRYDMDTLRSQAEAEVFF